MSKRDRGNRQVIPRHTTAMTNENTQGDNDRVRELLNKHGDRDRGILTESDRKFLIHEGENVNSEGTRYSTRHRIHNRLKNALLDWPLIVEKMPEDDLVRAFEPRDDVTDDDMQTAIRAMFEAVYTATVINGAEPDFEEALVGGIHDAILHREKSPALVNVQFDVTTSNEIDVEEAYERYQNGNWLSTAEYGALLASKKVPPEEAAELAEYAQTNTYFPGVTDVLTKEGTTNIEPLRPPDKDE